MRPRPIVPPGRAGLLVLAAATVPLVISRCKPLAKRMGEKMVEWGEKLQKEARKPDPSTAEETVVTAVAEPATATAVAEPVESPKPKAAPKKAASKSTAKPKAATKPKTTAKKAPPKKD